MVVNRGADCKVRVCCCCWARLLKMKTKSVVNDVDRASMSLQDQTPPPQRLEAHRSFIIFRRMSGWLLSSVIVGYLSVSTTVLSSSLSCSAQFVPTLIASIGFAMVALAAGGHFWSSCQFSMSQASHTLFFQTFYLSPHFHTKWLHYLYKSQSLSKPKKTQPVLDARSRPSL